MIDRNALQTRTERARELQQKQREQNYEPMLAELEKRLAAAADEGEDKLVLPQEFFLPYQSKGDTIATLDAVVRKWCQDRSLDYGDGPNPFTRVISWEPKAFTREQVSRLFPPDPYPTYPSQPVWSYTIRSRGIGEGTPTSQLPRVIPCKPEDDIISA